jgi:hypothetical protein
LKSGYARRDWRESDGLAKAIEDEVARQVAAILGVADAGVSPLRVAAAVQEVVSKTRIEYEEDGQPPSGDNDVDA